MEVSLGIQVQRFLESKGVATPQYNNQLSDNEKRQTIQQHFTKIMQALGMDLRDDSLADTPKRLAKMYVDEIFSGLQHDQFPRITTVENKMDYDEMIVVSGINVKSVCEHHFATIDGTCKIAYIPKSKVLGLSKFNRVVAYFSQRPQIQERLTAQIYWALVYVLGTEDVAVKIVADHHCVKSRGIKDENSFTTTSKLGGLFFDKAETRNEFLLL